MPSPPSPPPSLTSVKRKPTRPAKPYRSLAFLNAAMVNGSRNGAKLLRERGHAYFVELGRKGGQAKRKKSLDKPMDRRSVSFTRPQLAALSAIAAGSGLPFTAVVRACVDCALSVWQESTSSAPFGAERRQDWK